LLEKIGGWRTDRTSGQEGLTVAGLLMFGEDNAIRDPAAVTAVSRRLPRAIVGRPARTVDGSHLAGRDVGSEFVPVL
jgi:hypothetical protein